MNGGPSLALTLTPQPPSTMSLAALRLHIPTTITTSPSAAPINHRNDSDEISAFSQKYPEHKLTLEAVKRIWLSYSPVNIHPHDFNAHASLSQSITENRSVINEENVLCLDLGLAASVPTATASNTSTTIDSSVNTATLFSARLTPPGQSTSTRPGTMDGVERELGELTDDSRGGSIGPSSSQSDSNSGRRDLSLDQARSAFTDTLFKRGDPRYQSREQVYQEYMAHLDDDKMNQLIALGKDIFNDLSKMGDTKRKLSGTTSITAVGEEDRRVRRRLGKENFPVDTVGSVLSSTLEAHHGAKVNLSSSHILVVKEGRSHADIIEATFSLNGILDRNHWAYWSASRTESLAIKPPFRIMLCCILRSTVMNIISADRPPGSSSSYVADTFARTDTSWPEGGGLFVSLNHGHPEKAEILTPQTFAESPHQIDITKYILPEGNTISLVQLHDHSAYIFFVLAVPPDLGRGRVERFEHRGQTKSS